MSITAWRRRTTISHCTRKRILSLPHRAERASDDLTTYEEEILRRHAEDANEDPAATCARDRNLRHRAEGAARAESPQCAEITKPKLRDARERRFRPAPSRRGRERQSQDTAACESDDPAPPNRERERKSRNMRERRFCATAQRARATSQYARKKILSLHHRAGSAKTRCRRVSVLEKTFCPIAQRARVSISQHARKRALRHCAEKRGQTRR